MALNSTHIYIDWDPPPEDQHHGELQEYRITVNEIETSTSLLVSSDPDVTEATIGPLHPYYTYDCTILAVTVGEGPPSTVITVRTEEDGKQTLFIYVHCFDTCLGEILRVLICVTFSSIWASN